MCLRKRSPFGHLPLFLRFKCASDHQEICLISTSKLEEPQHALSVHLLWDASTAAVPSRACRGTRAFLTRQFLLRLLSECSLSFRADLWTQKFWEAQRFPNPNCVQYCCWERIRFRDVGKSERKMWKEFSKARIAGNGSGLAGSRERGRTEGGREAHQTLLSIGQIP